MQERGSPHADGADERLHDAAARTSSAVQQAAGVLEEQLSQGLSEVRQLTSTFAAERRLDQAAFEQLVGRFRQNARDLVEVAAARAEDLRGDEAQDLVKRFADDAADMIDSVLDLVVALPSMVERTKRKRADADEQQPGTPTPQPLRPPGPGGG